ncbi:MAG: zinc-ribbon domain-containing protein [Bacillota bacterium]|uniref:zinc ribbon domain-containing protein n=1 Tax=Desulfurispora thermophila TaxID=265470 RepID=UPI00036272BC|nr:zinc ribbon domain-containing protein [Desulfurispora thermophila]
MEVFKRFAETVKDITRDLGEKAKDIGEKARDIGEKALDLGEKAGDRAKDVAKKSVEFVGAQKLKLELSRYEKEMENNMAALGYLYYKSRQGDVSQQQEMEELYQRTLQLEQDIRQLEEEINKLLPRPPVCPQCQKELPPGGRFCSYCGRQVVGEEQRGTPEE